MNRRNPLDGRVFRGEIVDGGGAARATDVVAFSNGLLRSDRYREFGFQDAPYWTRLEGDVLHFRAESGPGPHGRMAYRGTVSASRIELSGVWTKKRWYWTIRREVRFTGAETR